MKKMLMYWVVVVCSFLFATTAFADTDSVGVLVNDTPMVFDVAPIIEDGRTLVPLRAISEYLNYDVTWYGADRMVEIKNADCILNIYIDKTEYIRNGVIETMDVPAKIIEDRTLVPLRLIAEAFGCEVLWDQDTLTAYIIRYNVVEVEDANALLQNIDSYTKLVLTGKTYNLSEALDEALSEHVVVEEVFDGFEHTIQGVTFLSIEAEEGRSAEIVVEPRYADVLQFRNCANIVLKNITAGHTEEQGYCTGGVLMLENTYGVEIENCRLYGCGTYGITGENCGIISVSNTEIYECTYGAVNLANAEVVLFDSCMIRDCEALDILGLYDCSAVVFSNCTIENNKSDSEWADFIEASGSKDIIFEYCRFINNEYMKFIDEFDDVTFTDCEFLVCDGMDPSGDQ